MPNSLELNVSPAQLHTFANHPFHVRKDMEMNELVDSIRESGVIVPLIVRSRPEGGYEIISGHRRCEACRELGIEKVPVRVQELTDDEATILMVNSNIQREHVLPSEKAFAYRMKLEAVKRTAGRPSKNSCQVGTNFRADKNVAETSSESARTIQRYIRLTYLISPILQMVDESRMAFTPAVEISYMTPEHQRWLQAEMELCEATPSLVQSRRLKEMSQSGTLTEHYLHTLLTEQKPNQRQKFFLNQSDVQRFFPPGYTPEQMQNTIFSLLKTWGHAHEHKTRFPVSFFNLKPDFLWRIVLMKKNRERSIGKLLYFTEQELETIQNKMVESDMSNFSAYCREMLLTGKVKHYDFSVIKEISSSLSHISGNINQVAKRCNTNQSVTTNDVEQLRREYLQLKSLYQERLVKALRKLV